MFREALFAFVLLAAAVCLVVGVGHFTIGGAWMVAGVLLAAIGWLVLGGEPDPRPDDDGEVVE